MTKSNAYVAAFIYGLRLIDEKARARGVFKIPDIPTENVEPDIDAKALIVFTQKVASRIIAAEESP